MHTKNQLNVEVLGTEFSVFSRNNRNKVELKKGSVKLLFNNQQGMKPLIMKPGDIVSVETGGKLLVKHQQPLANFIPWKEHRFVFDNTSLDDVVSSIKEFFGDNIIIGDSALNGMNITGSFKAESSAELLRALAEIYELELINDSGKGVLKQKNSE